jgi:hypothetical protein
LTLQTSLAEQAKSRLTSSKHEDSVLGMLRDLPESPSPDNAAQVALVVTMVKLQAGAAGPVQTGLVAKHG